MTNEVLTEAIKEAYASAPSDVILLHTLELRHPNFVDEDGNKSAIRVVRDHQNLTATLEATAPLNAGEEVTFINYPFNFTLPSVDDKVNPEVKVTIDNVDRSIIRNIDLAAESSAVINLTYRPYLSNDLTGPQYDPPLHLILTNITADVFKITGTARFGDLANLKFPKEVYEPSRFPGLVR